MVGMRNETIISMRFVRSKLRKREESSHVVNSTEATQPTHVVSSVEPVGFRQSPSSVWHFPPLAPQPNLYIYNASSQVSTKNFSVTLVWSSLEAMTWTHFLSTFFFDNSVSRESRSGADKPLKNPLSTAALIKTVWQFSLSSFFATIITTRNPFCMGEQWAGREGFEFIQLRFEISFRWRRKVFPNVSNYSRVARDLHA